MIAPRLRPGDTIGLISPSHIATPDGYARIISALENRGFAVKPGKNLYKSAYGYSASEAERAEDFNDMVLDPDVKMVFFGGGEAGNELLPHMDFEGIARHPKIYASYSDGTTILSAIWAKTGLVTYYGQSPGIFEDLRYYDYMQFCSHFLYEYTGAFARNSPWRTMRGGACEGTLVGGYTRNFALLINSRYFAYDAGKKYVLFLEDHEKFSGLDTLSSYLSHIEQSDFMENVSGLLFGHYSTTAYPGLFEMLERFGVRNDIPVVHCDDFGHGANHAILPIGSDVRLDADRQTMEFIGS